MTYSIAVGILFLVVLALLRFRAPLDSRPTQPQQRRFVVVCGQCGVSEEVEGFTEEVVGKWGEKIKCSKCRGAA